MTGKNTPEVQQCQAFNSQAQWLVLRLSATLALLLGLFSCRVLEPVTLAPKDARIRLDNAARTAEGSGIEGVTAMMVRSDGRSFSWSWPQDEGLEEQEFALASVSKIYTTALILDLARQGSLSIDEVIPTYSVTPRHLLTHTSGLSAEKNGLQQLVPPGLRYDYSNQAFSFLATATETSSARNWNGLLDDTVLLANGLSSTRVMAEGDLPPGSGGIMATPRDVLMFGRLWFEPAAFPLWKTAVEGGLSNFQPPLVAGWRSEWKKRGEVHRLFHAGAIDGAGAELSIYPGDDVVIVILSRGRYDAALYRRIRRILERAAEVKRPRLMAVPEVEYDGLNGVWRSGSGAKVETIELVIRRGRVMMTDPAGDAVELQEVSARRFVPVRNGNDDLAKAFEVESGSVLEVIAPATRAEGLLWQNTFFERAE